MTVTREITHLIIHCSATKPNQDIGAVDIDRWHRAKGWFGNGYHAVIRRDGTFETAANGNRCRTLNQAGAHVGDCGPGWNRRSIGICMAGGINDAMKPENNFIDPQWKTLEEGVLSFVEHIPTIKYIGGHRDLIAITGASPKACPSFSVWSWFEEIAKQYPDFKRLQMIKPITPQ
jgi:N-acetylmuramoyl-L-alanine amidase